MNVRFVMGRDREPLELSLPDDRPLPRVGESVTLPVATPGEGDRWGVKTVNYDYSDPDRVTVEIQVGVTGPARVPSFSVYTD
ncbi:hypothetical protein SAMN05443575_0027 [Jatrophihabitans endophyticus]|uniref:Uncharacterized protein n=1 Tax=Jatrophihabitans endophyticus TaxID=1206085 RepID=A0A1M5BXB8_9ACTN|nr:hypothetical protein [Jatrophihabitans endophyticus]SHF47184.1 hypothetical protein SAMN05443575_0027 [Jatrophihabitans endophyticus]